jgi:hypothetical protein
MISKVYFNSVKYTYRQENDNWRFASVIIFIVPRPSCEKWSHNLRSQKWPRDLHSQKMVTWPAHLTQRFLRSTCPVFTSVSLSCLWLQSGPPIYDCTYLLRYLDIHEVSPGYQCVITLKYKIHILRWVETWILRQSLRFKNGRELLFSFLKIFTLFHIDVHLFPYIYRFLFIFAHE